MKISIFSFAASVLAFATGAVAQTSPPPVESPAVVPASEEKKEDKKPAIEEPRAKLDYSDGAFYLRSKDDRLVLVPSGRMQIDTYAFAGPGVSDYTRANGTGLATHMLFRRFILEMGGLVRNKWFFWLGGNFAPNRVDDNQATFSTASVYDGWIGYDAAPEFKIMGGQFNIPVSMENVTSSRWLDLMERSVTARLAAPFNKDLGLMAWGSAGSGLVDYQLAVVGGDGQNRPTPDSRWDVMPRVIVRPLAKREDALGKLHVGMSARYGSRDPNHIWYEAPSLSSPGGFTFFASTYGPAATRTRIIPTGAQLAVGGEVYVPFDRFDLRGELFYFNERRREASVATPGTSIRVGAQKGVSWYAQASFWPWGTPRINGNPGNYGVPKLPKDLGKESPHGVQIVARFEMVRLRYDADAIAGVATNPTDNLFLNVYQLGANYWATKHIRLTAEYSLYQVPKDNLAQAPGQKANGNNPDARHFHEISFRFGLSL
jgi:phosphate-selective porin